MPDLFIDPELRPASYYRPDRRGYGGGGGGSTFGKLLLLGVILLLVAGGVAYFLLKRNVVLDNVVPTVQAEAGPIKQRPDDPGGVTVLHQDTTAYDRLDKADGRKMEQLLPPAETPNEKLLMANPPAEVKPAPAPVESRPAGAVPPLPVERVVPAPETSAAKTPEPPKPITETRTIASVPAPKPAPVPADTRPTTMVPQPFKTPAEMKAAEMKPPAAVKKPIALTPTPVAPAPKPAETAPLDVAGILAKSGVTKSDTLDAKAEVAAEPVTTSPPVSAAPAKGMSRVQLASSTDQAAAEKKMMDMVSTHADLLRKTRLTTVRADLGAKGIYYRIQTQAMPSADATQLCASLKAARLECIIVKVAP